MQSAVYKVNVLQANWSTIINYVGILNNDVLHVSPIKYNLIFLPFDQNVT